jgi:hypothetical protein
VAETKAALDALNLELRDSDGVPVPMRQVTIQDVWNVGSAAEVSAGMRARAVEAELSLRAQRRRNTDAGSPASTPAIPSE